MAKPSTIVVPKGQKHVCPRCQQVCVPAVGLTAVPECNGGHVSTRMRAA